MLEEEDDDHSFLACFAGLNDPRVERSKLYPIEEILFLVLCGTMCGMSSWRELEDYGEMKLDFLRGFFPYENGTPSKSTLARLFAVLDPAEFGKCFSQWAQIVEEEIKQIAIDGKTLRNSSCKFKNLPAINMVSAYATDLRLVLGQVRVNDKSNEIKAIAPLLDLLSVEGAVVTIDAIGCQKKVTKEIKDRGGEYVLALKANQETLHDEVKTYLDDLIKNHPFGVNYSYYHALDKEHGRIEDREAWITEEIGWLDKACFWEGLRSIGCIRSERMIGEKQTTEWRYFISSLPADAEKFATCVRNHWRIENNLHWSLDVIFQEDMSTIHNRNAAENMAIVRHLTLNLLQRAKEAFPKKSVKLLKKRTSIRDDFLVSLFTQDFSAFAKSRRRR